MKFKKTEPILLIFLAGFLMFAGTLALTNVFAASSTTFTYQGFLKDGGVPVNGTFDFEFQLYDDGSAGAQVGSTLNSEDISVVNGYFNVTLDFGAAPFDGSQRWLQIGVRPGGSTGSYTLLTPRVELTPVPYAIYGEDADADPANELNTGLFLTGTVLSLVDSGGALSVDLASLNQDPRTPISSIPTTINQPGSYYLTQNVTNTGSYADGITIDANHVTLDLNGFTLADTGVGDDGIVVRGDQDNIHIKNGVVRGWGGDGINALNADNSIFENLHVENNGYDGLVGDFGVIIINCTSVGNRYDGLEGDDGTIIKNSTAVGNGDNGIQSSEGTISIGNASSDNARDGFDLASGSLFINNAARGNSGFGFDIALSGQAQNNSASGNLGNGFDIASASLIMGNTSKNNGTVGETSNTYLHGFRTFANAYLINNVAEGNVQDGFRISSTDVFLDSNQGYNNGEYGLQATSSGSLFVGNSAAGNTTGDFAIIATSAYGQIITGTASTDQPFANFDP
ncbi:MAG: right-handed parallel beta-helix repeat-containing protein [Ardenticatenaceae bacterium]|nr:right-handed parallel beta-helix repeat-containing protein [Ardenticatenaceae bacterium]